jgi:hypothetical protein
MAVKDDVIISPHSKFQEDYLTSSARLLVEAEVQAHRNHMSGL